MSKESETEEMEVTSQEDETDTGQSITNLVANSNPPIENSFKCLFCEETFLQESKLRAHMMLHGQSRIYRCEFCDKIFSKSSNLTSHIRTHTGEKPYICRICGKSFPWISSLRTHIPSMHNVEKKDIERNIIKTGSVEYYKIPKDKLGDGNDEDEASPSESSCPSDNGIVEDKTSKKNAKGQQEKDEMVGGEGKEKRRLDNKPSLKPAKTETKETEHYIMKTEYFASKGRPFVCQAKNKKVTYICKLCSKEANTKSNVMDHVRTHSNSKMYKCQYCGKGLSRKQNLIHHLKFVHFMACSNLDAKMHKNEEYDSSLSAPELLQSKDEKIIKSETSDENQIEEDLKNIDGMTHGIEKTEDGEMFLTAVKQSLNESSVSLSALNDSSMCSAKDAESEQESTLDASYGNLSTAEENSVSNLDNQPDHFETIKGQTAIENKYRCKICGFVTDRRYYMQYQHIFKHTGEKKYLCVVCNKPYTRRYVLKRHIYKHHKISGEELERVTDASKMAVSGRWNPTSNTAKQLDFTAALGHSEMSSPLADSNLLSAEGKPEVSMVTDISSNSEKSKTHDELSKYYTKVTKSDQTVLKSAEAVQEKSADIKLVNGLKRPFCGEESELENLKSKKSRLTPNTSANEERDISNNHTDIEQDSSESTSNEYSYSILQGEDGRGKRYKCDLCGFISLRRYYMDTDHMMKHLGQKPYLCVVCCKAFSRRYNLKIHLVREHRITGSELEDLMKITGERVDTNSVLPTDPLNQSVEFSDSLTEETIDSGTVPLTHLADQSTEAFGSVVGKRVELSNTLYKSSDLSAKGLNLASDTEETGDSKSVQETDSMDHCSDNVKSNFEMLGVDKAQLKDPADVSSQFSRLETLVNKAVHSDVDQVYEDSDSSTVDLDFDAKLVGGFDNCPDIVDN